jgi:hypothetical protein
MSLVILLAAFAFSAGDPIDLTGDGKLQKMVLQPGSGTVKPVPEQKVEIRYVGWLKFS